MSDGAERPVEPEASAIVLAGGQSARLGSDKALLPVEGQPLLARTVGLLRALSDDVVVVTNDPSRYAGMALPARLVADESPGLGSLMGIYSGLRVVRHERALTVACDMPFLNPGLLRYLLSLSEGYDVVIPRLEGLLEPLHAVYRRECLPAMARVLAEGRRPIVSFFPEVRVRYVEAQEIDRFDAGRLSFVNINTRQDWQQVQELLKGAASPGG
jgi:molybdenum cofactor guanylyltransferase